MSARRKIGSLEHILMSISSAFTETSNLCDHITSLIVTIDKSPPKPETEPQKGLSGAFGELFQKLLELDSHMAELSESWREFCDNFYGSVAIDATAEAIAEAFDKVLKALHKQDKVWSLVDAEILPSLVYIAKTDSSCTEHVNRIREMLPIAQKRRSDLRSSVVSSLREIQNQATTRGVSVLDVLQGIINSRQEEVARCEEITKRIPSASDLDLIAIEPPLEWVDEKIWE
jgi:hypothetical protein